MKFPITLVPATLAAASMLLAVLCQTAGRAQDADESSTYEARETGPITQVAGTWSGTDTLDEGDQGSGSGPMTLDLTQHKKTIDGTFSITAGDETPVGKLAGKISGNDLTLTFHTTGGTEHKCTAAVMATVDGDTMSGTFLVKGNHKHCNGKGTFDLQLQ
jgi:hypothetical protein